MQKSYYQTRLSQILFYFLILFQNLSVYDSPLLIKNKYKKTICKFCELEIVSKHFVRHLKNKHADKSEVADMLRQDDSKIRKQLIALIRNDGNLTPGLHGEIRPKRLMKDEEATDETHTFCPDCKSQLKKTYLSRHRKYACFAKKSNDDDSVERKQEVMNSYIYVACNKKYGNVISRMFLKSEVLAHMRGDTTAEEILKDILILSWGEDLLKKTPTNRSKYHLSAKMRRCANFLIEMRKSKSRYTNMISCLKPDAFDDVVQAAKKISGFDPESRTYRAASTGLQFGAYLKQLASLAKKLIYCKKISITNEPEKCLQDLETFRTMVNDHWTIEVASLAKKDLEKKASKKIAVLPLTENIMKLKKHVDEVSQHSYEELRRKINKPDYQRLAETTLASCILHNRKRVSDIQYLEVQDYQEQRQKIEMGSKATEFLETLSDTEKVLLKNYVKINSIGKGSRTVPVLIPKEHVKYWDMISKIRREKAAWFPRKNDYFFKLPGSVRWINGTYALQKYANACQVPRPDLMTSSRLRKHVATVSQLLNLKDNDIDQLARFMGHTTATHQTYYK